ncbi:MAG TPA: hypothetical protein VMU47_24680 [Caldimonas sp.]|nr:hypothetical protein [Caldimonas sp.]
MPATVAALPARGVSVLVALAAFSAGLVIAVHHPTGPGWATTGFLLWCVAASWRGAWLFALPALLPCASLAPWTGWVAIDEFDLLVLGAIAAGHARLARVRIEATTRDPEARRLIADAPFLLTLLFAVTTTLALFRGLPAGLYTFDWFDGYADPINSLRVAKSALFAVLLMPVLRDACRASKRNVIVRFTAGMLVGSAVAALAVVHERAGYPGLFDFSTPYRVVALFWEMHVGGAAIDAYLAMSAPFVAAAVVTARKPLPYAAAATLALLFEYASLTTFSRGVYLALPISLVLLALLLRSRGSAKPAPPWRRHANVCLMIAVVLQLAAIATVDSYMLSRVQRSGVDFRGRLLHWRNGLRALHGSADWWLGIGLGRLPGIYAATVAGHPFTGVAKVENGHDQHRLTLSSSAHDDAIASAYRLTQRIALTSPASQAAMDVRTRSDLRLFVSVCEMHLLYEGTCQRGEAHVMPSAEWQRVVFALGEPLPAPAQWPPAQAVFSVGLASADSAAEIERVSLFSDGGENRLANADFSSGLAHWYPVTTDHFVPWHIDSLALELLIERGLLGLAAFSGLLAYAFSRLLGPGLRGSTPGAVLAASLLGALLVGVIDSVLDAPRVAFLLLFLTFLSIALSDSQEGDALVVPATTPDDERKAQPA